MSEEFFKATETRYSDINFKEKWDKKCATFFDNFTYLNSEVLIQDQIGKLTHVGINSIKNSSSLIQNMTSENIQVMEDQLKTVIGEMSALTNKFDILEKALKQKTGLFSSKTSSQVFFETFKQEERLIRQQINELNLKGQSLEDVKNNLQHNIEQLIDAYVLLERDLRLLKLAEESLGNNDKALIPKVYNKNMFDITNVKSELLTHQQIVYQKYAGIRILMENVLNCHKNINYVSRVTFSVIMNVVELQQIITLGQTKFNDKQNQALVKVKAALSMVANELKSIAAQPFASHSN